MLASITFDCGNSLPPSAAGADRERLLGTEKLVSGGQEVGHSRQGDKGSKPLGIEGRLG